MTNHYTKPESGIMTCYTSSLLTTSIVIKRPWLTILKNGTTKRQADSDDGLAALVSKLDNLGRDMKKLKESIHAIRVKCQVCEGHHPDKNFPLNEEVKGIEEVKYREYGNPFSNHNRKTKIQSYRHLRMEKDKS
ncbi:hypothetical protein Tco_0728684 [Tanacetum coccineum]|uniref:Uncharacterized protein n=1 Tax=Tanacetum coccineum TaxID=301880 RepID=A0ABQ4YQA9_9ASTR